MFPNVKHSKVEKLKSRKQKLRGGERKENNKKRKVNRGFPCKRILQSLQNVQKSPNIRSPINEKPNMTTTTR